MTTPKNTNLNWKSLFSRLKSLPGPLSRLFADRISARGAVLIEAVYSDGWCETLVDDSNLVVSLGRKCLSRLLSGIAGAPTITTTTTPAIYVVRDTNGSPTTAHVTVENDGNDTVVTGYSGAVVELSKRFVGGVFTISQLVDSINGVAHWSAKIIGSTDTVDATNLLRTPNAPCLGDQASYAGLDIALSSRSRILYATKTVTTPVTSVDSLFVSRMRFGSQGHNPANSLLGKDVLATDERLTSHLRSSDLGNVVASQDYVTLDTVSYPGSAQVSFVATLGTLQGNGLDISEVGLFTGTSGSVGDFMVARKNFGVIHKSDTFGVRVTWSIVF